jgi:hypothetical protein
MKACLREPGDRAAALERFEPLLTDLVHLPADHGEVLLARRPLDRRSATERQRDIRAGCWAGSAS